MGVGAAAWEVRRQYVARTETVAWVASYKLRWLNCRLHRTIRVKISCITIWFSEAKSLLTLLSRKNASPKTTVFRRHSKYRCYRQIRESKEEKRTVMGRAQYYAMLLISQCSAAPPLRSPISNCPYFLKLQRENLSLFLLKFPRSLRESSHGPSTLIGFFKERYFKDLFHFLWAIKQ